MNSSNSGGERKDSDTIDGRVEEVLPRAMYRVRLSSGREVRAGVSSRARHSVVRLIAGDRVAVKLSSQDPNRGQITEKL